LPSGMRTMRGPKSLRGDSDGIGAALATANPSFWVLYFDGAFDWLSKFTNKRYAPGTPAGNSRKNDNPV